MHKVFIGSTSIDLREYRESVRDVCLELGFFPIMMEHFEAMGEGATKGSKHKLDEADVYVGLFAFRYGYIEAGYDRSVTEIEFDYAGERGLERLCFLADPSHPWPTASMDPQNADRLQAFKSCINTLIRAQFTTPDNLKSEVMLALVKWRERHPAAANVLSAVLADIPDDLLEQPDPTIGLIGRDALREQVHTQLTRRKRVLLQGLGGMGKTALAATVAAEWIEAGGPALWLNVGEADPDVICAALAVPFGDQGKEVANATGDARLQALRHLLVDAGVKLLVLDDVWNGAALATVMKAVPRDLPVLITARQIYPRFKHVKVGGLDRESSLELLKLHADAGDEIKDSAAQQLCDLLGDHPFALCLAGEILETVPGMTPARLLERIQDKPFEMALPTDEQRTFMKLLQASLDTLDSPDARAVFYAFGAMTVPSATEELLALYLSHAGQDVDVGAALEQLGQHGLVDYIVPKVGRGSYRMHRLVYSVARADFLKTNDHPPDFEAVRTAVCDYTRLHKTDLPALDVEINNILGTAEQARSADPAFLVEIMLLLVEEGTYTEFRGFTPHTLELLSAAIDAALNTDPRAAHFLLGKRGDYYDQFVGQKDQALRDYNAALALSEQIGDPIRQAVILTTIGTVRFDQGAGDSASYHQRAFDLATTQHDDYALALVTFNRGVEEFSNEDGGSLDTALRLFQEAGASASRLIQAGQATTRLKKVHYSALLNSGACQNELGRLDEAIATHQQAYAFAHELDNRLWMAYAQQGLGEDFDMLKQRPQAQAAFDQAYALFVAGGVASSADALKRFMQEQGYTVPSD